MSKRSSSSYVFSLCRRAIDGYASQFWMLSATALIAASTYAQEPTMSAVGAAERTSKFDATTILRPYLGKWRPTSYQEELNVGSLTITETEFSVEATGASVTFVIERQTKEGVVVKVTGRKSADTFPRLTNLAFMVESETVTGPPPANLVKTRELLWICYLSGNLDRLASGIKKTCGNIYTR